MSKVILQLSPIGKRHYLLAELKMLENFIKVSTSKYWHRLWIIKEFVLSRGLQIWAGSTVANGLLFVRDYDIQVRWVDIDKESNYERFGQEGISIPAFKQSAMSTTLNCRIAYGQDYMHTSDVYLGSLNIFHRVRSAECSDDRDRVYGLLDLISPKEMEQFPIMPDYTESKSELFAELWKRHIDQLNSRRPSSATFPYSLRPEYLRYLLQLPKPDKPFIASKSMSSRMVYLKNL
jgi:hypothetical protein